MKKAILFYYRISTILLTAAVTRSIKLIKYNKSEIYKI
ncbi:hypothetical protein M2326_002734 [Flavobacterium sp. 7A]|nr:hypothetical protein [Flavobacterium sp. 7A]